LEVQLFLMDDCSARGVVILGKYVNCNKRTVSIWKYLFG